MVRAALLHAVDAHGHEDTPELRERIRAALRDASGAQSTAGAAGA